MKTGISLIVETPPPFFVVGGYPRLDDGKRWIMFCHKTNAVFSFIFCDSDLSKIQIRGGCFHFFFPYNVLFSYLDWSGEAGTVQKGHRTTSPTDKARNTHKPVLRQ